MIWSVGEGKSTGDGGAFLGGGHAMGYDWEMYSFLRPRPERASCENSLYPYCPLGSNVFSGMIIVEVLLVQYLYLCTPLPPQSRAGPSEAIPR
jgi:hypothetical protein